MDYAITEESFVSLNSYWDDSKRHLNWSSIFVLPGWLHVWWQAFGDGMQLYLRAVRQEGEVIGIAPLQVRDSTASIIGGVDVCDYLDFIVAPGRERDFFTALLDDLAQKGINQLDLRSLRPDSATLTSLAPIARERNYEVLCHEEGISVGLDLPATWDEYLATLDKKQRHEIRRKLRRLEEAGNIDYCCVKVGEEVGDFIDRFLKLFPLSREDKASFMTPQMESFFRSLAETMAESGLLQSGILKLDGLPVAMTMSFDYNGAVYLYNSAYDPNYRHLSVGLLSKILGMRESMRHGRRKWDFLKGGEPYKYHIGGKEIPLYRCQITMKRA